MRLNFKQTRVDYVTDAFLQNGRRCSIIDRQDGGEQRTWESKPGNNLFK